MIETHSIRLRGPWEFVVGGVSKRIRMPVRRADVVGDDFRDRLTCQRKFGCPTCLDPHERVWLVIEMPARPGEATLNGLPLGPFHNTAKPTEFDITERLKERNVLVLDFDFVRPLFTASSRDSAAGELLFKDVRLEIRG
jgi:hypothetical protein